MQYIDSEHSDKNGLSFFYCVLNTINDREGCASSQVLKFVGRF